MNNIDLYELNAEQFEKLCFEYTKRIYNGDQYELEHTSFQCDGGKDIQISFRDKLSNYEYNIWAECKRHSRNIGLQEIGKNVVLVIANAINKIIFFSVSNITETAQITISKVAEIFHFEVSYLYGDYLIAELSKYPDILKHFFPNNNYKNNMMNNLVFTKAYISEYEDRQLCEVESNKDFNLHNGDIIYFYVHTKNMDTIDILESLSFAASSSLLQFNVTSKDIIIPSGSDAIVRFEGRIIGKNCSGKISLPDMSVSIRDNNENLSVFTIQWPSLNLAKCKKYPVIGKKFHEFFSNKYILKMLSSELNKLIVIHGGGGTGKTRFSDEICCKLLMDNYVSFKFDANRNFDFDIIRNIFCEILGLPSNKNVISFEKKDVREMIQRYGGSQDFVAILSDFLVDNRIETKDLKYLNSAFNYFVMNALREEPMCLVIDNFQNLNEMSIRFLLESSEQILKYGKKFILLFIINTDSIPEERQSNFELYKRFFESLDKEFSNQYINIECAPYELPDIQVFLMTLFGITDPQNQFMVKLLKKIGTTPFEIIMTLEYLGQQDVIKWLDQQIWMIEDVNKFNLVLTENLKDVKNVIYQRLLKIEKSFPDKTKKDNFKEIVSTILFFCGSVPYEYIEELDDLEDSIEYLENTLWIKWDSNEGLQFYHDNIYNFFLQQPKYMVSDE